MKLVIEEVSRRQARRGAESRNARDNAHESERERGPKKEATLGQALGGKSIGWIGAAQQEMHAFKIGVKRGQPGYGLLVMQKVGPNEKLFTISGPFRLESTLEDVRAYLVGDKKEGGRIAAGVKVTIGAPPAEPDAPAAKDWRDEENWHAKTQARMKTLTGDQLRYIAKDATEAAAAMPDGKKAGQHTDEAHYANMELKRRADAKAAKAGKAATPAAAPAAAGPEPKHLADMREKAKAIKTRISAGHGYTASDWKLANLYDARLSAQVGRWQVGHGVSYQVAAGGGSMQTNRGFQIAEISPADKMARIRQVADTGLTETGGDHDRIGDMWIYLGELKRDRKYDAAPAQPAAPQASPSGLKAERVDFTAHRHPVMAVPCSDCGAGVGHYCKRPSGHSGPMVAFHKARKDLADSIWEQQGDPPIERTRGGEWKYSPPGTPEDRGAP